MLDRNPKFFFAVFFAIEHDEKAFKIIKLEQKEKKRGKEFFMEWEVAKEQTVECPKNIGESGTELYVNSFWTLNQRLLFVTDQRSIIFDTNLT